MHQEYLQHLPVLADTKILIPKKWKKEIDTVIKKIINISQTPEHKNNIKNIFSKQKEVSIFLDQNKDISLNFASFDFHFQKDFPVAEEEKKNVFRVSDQENVSDPQLIEFSYFPPGLAFLAGGIACEQHKGIIEKNILSLAQNHQSIAIIDTRLHEQLYFPEFKWLKNFLRENGKQAIIAPAEEIEWDGENIFFNNKKIDFIFNRLPFSDYLSSPEKYKSLLEIEKNSPEKLSTTYSEWIYSEKITSAIFSDNALLSHYIPLTKQVSKYETIEEIKNDFSRSKTILKPFFSNAGKGIFIKPSQKYLEKVFTEDKENYLVQKIVPAMKLSDGRKWDLRVVMINKKIISYIARIYSGSITNFKEKSSGMCSVCFY